MVSAQAPGALQGWRTVTYAMPCNALALVVAAILTSCSGSSHANSSTTTTSSTAATSGPTAARSSIAELRGGAVATGRPRSSRSSASWDRLRVGLRVYTGDDGGDATTQTVCASLAAYLASIDDSNTPHCLHVKRGLSATVETIIPSKSSDSDAGFRAPHVQLRGSDGTWSGYTTVVPLQPAIPIGTVLVMKKDGNATVNLAPRQGSDLNAGPDLGDTVTVKVLHYYPDTGDRPLYVTVLDGEHAGQNGWMFANEAETPDGYSGFTLTYTIPSPSPTIDPVKRTYNLTSKLRVFSDLQTCKDAFNAMESDTAFKNLKNAVQSGAYHDFDSGDKLRIVSDPDPSDLWVIVSDDNGNQGCVSRYNLPGY